MKVKELIEFLNDCDQDYTGCDHCLLEIEATYYPKGQKVDCKTSWVSFVDKNKIAKVPVVTIIGKC